MLRFELKNRNALPCVVFRFNSSLQKDDIFFVPHVEGIGSVYTSIFRIDGGIWPRKKDDASKDGLLLIGNFTFPSNSSPGLTSMKSPAVKRVTVSPEGVVNVVPTGSLLVGVLLLFDGILLVFVDFFPSDFATFLVAFAGPRRAARGRGCNRAFTSSTEK